MELTLRFCGLASMQHQAFRAPKTSCSHDPDRMEMAGVVFVHKPMTRPKLGRLVDFCLFKLASHRSWMKLVTS